MSERLISLPDPPKAIQRDKVDLGNYFETQKMISVDFPNARYAYLSIMRCMLPHLTDTELSSINETVGRTNSTRTQKRKFIEVTRAACQGFFGLQDAVEVQMDLFSMAIITSQFASPTDVRTATERHEMLATFIKQNDEARKAKFGTKCPNIPDESKLIIEAIKKLQKPNCNSWRDAMRIISQHPEMFGLQPASSGC